MVAPDSGRLYVDGKLIDINDPTHTHVGETLQKCRLLQQ